MNFVFQKKMNKNDNLKVDILRTFNLNFDESTTKIVAFYKIKNFKNS